MSDSASSLRYLNRRRDGPAACPGGTRSGPPAAGRPPAARRAPRRSRAPRTPPPELPVPLRREREVEQGHHRRVHLARAQARRGAPSASRKAIRFAFGTPASDHGLLPARPRDDPHPEAAEVLDARGGRPGPSRDREVPHREDLAREGDLLPPRRRVDDAGDHVPLPAQQLRDDLGRSRATGTTSIRRPWMRQKPSSSSRSKPGRPCSPEREHLGHLVGRHQHAQRRRQAGRWAPPPPRVAPTARHLR